MSKYAAPRTDFGEPPPNYVPGVGRGAVGFSTRGDFGAAKYAPPPGAGGPGGGPAPPPGFRGSSKSKPKEGDYSDAKFDKFSGFGENLFDRDPYDKEDQEADAIYEAIDDRMESRRTKAQKRKREADAAANKEQKITEHFRDLKRNLGELDVEAWESIPEAMDQSRQNEMMKKKLKADREKFTALPDSLIGAAAGSHTELDLRQQQGTAVGSGMETPLGMATPLSGPADLTQLGRARDKVLSLKLDSMADSVTGQTVIDPKGYLTDLATQKVNSESEISDIKKAQLLLRSVTTTNPKHAPGWIAAARLEEETGKMTAARRVILQGCEACPKSEDVWLEAARLVPDSKAKSVLAKAVEHCPISVKIWVEACRLEKSVDDKKAVLRRALELIPRSVALWKAAIELEDADDARILLARAVELIPTAVEMWLALARLETYDNARKVLNRARSVIPTEPAIWISAAKLEEAHGNVKNVDFVIAKAVKSLTAHQVVISREAWLKDAELAEKTAAPATCAALVRHTVGMGVEDQDRLATWSNDVAQLVARGSMGTARALYAHMLSLFPTKEDIWMKAAQLEKTHFDSQSMIALLEKAVQYCPQAEVLWLMRAKELWMDGNVPAARNVLNDAFAANPDSEQVWLAAVKLESENKEMQRARMLLARARDRAGTPRVWMKSASFERQQGEIDKCCELLKQGLRLYPKAWKLWVMLAQVEAERNPDTARRVCVEACKKCPDAFQLWLCAARLEMDLAKKNGNFGRARSLLETARLKIPACPELWLEAILVESAASVNKKAAESLLAKALQECPESGKLWAYAIANDPRPVRKSRSYDALNRVSDDPYVFAAVARLFWSDGKVKKARNWFNRAVKVDPDLGDVWAYMYKFELECDANAGSLDGVDGDGDGKANRAASVLKKCVDADPRHGELWTAVSKDVRLHGLSTGEILKRVAANIKDIF